MLKNIYLKKLLMNTLFPVLSCFNAFVPKKEGTILLYSNMGFRDNVRYIYDYLIDNQYNTKYKIYVSSNEDPKLKEGPDENIFVINNVQGIIRFLSTTHVFYSFGKIPIIPSKKQCVIQMWHGTPFKGIDGNIKNTTSKKSFYTYALLSSDYFKEIGKKLFSCDTDNIAICGQPRTDVMYHQKEKYDFLTGFRKIILWMPTFRQSKLLGYDDVEYNHSIIPFFDNKELIDINNKLFKENINLIIKLHPAQDLDHYQKVKLSNLNLLSHKEFLNQNIDLYKLLGQVDALITDYSSVFYDFMLMDKPIAFTMEDFEKYKENRGFVLEDPEYVMAGYKIKNKIDLLQFINDISNNIDIYKEKRHEVNDLVNTYQDGENRKRVLTLSGIKI